MKKLSLEKIRSWQQRFRPSGFRVRMRIENDQLYIANIKECNKEQGRKH